MCIRDSRERGQAEDGAENDSGADQLGGPLGVGGDLADEEGSEPEPDQDEQHPGGGQPEGVDAHLCRAQPPGHDHGPGEGRDPGRCV